MDVRIDSPVLSIQASSNGDFIFLGTKSGKVIVVSNRSGELLQEVDHKAGSINALAINSDENSLLCGCENGMVYRHSTENINLFSEFYEHDGSITSIEVSDENQLIAISSGDGTISLFKNQTFEFINKLKVGKQWVRNIAFNVDKQRLLCVGDAGKLYEWNIANINKARLINQTKVSSNWLLSLDIGQEGDIEGWGGLDHILRVRTRFGSYKLKLKGPILKIRFIIIGSSQIYIACCVLGKGIQVIPLKEMEFK